MIFSAEVVSEASRGFWYIMYCSAQLKVRVLSVKQEEYHW